MKRMLSLLLTACLLLGFAACGIHTPSVSPGSNDGSAPPNISDEQDKNPDQSDSPLTDETPANPSENNEEDRTDETEIPDGDTETEEPPVEDEEPPEPEEYVRTVDPYGRMVALTFDDGPHELFSHQILDVLEEYHAVATFFEVGYNAVRYPEILVRMASLGCEIGSHSYYHHDLTLLSKNAMLTDLGKLDQVIYDAVGFMPTLVRPPYGAVNNVVKYQSGRAMILWTVDTQDWLHRDAQVLIDYIQNYGDLDGQIVLMHSIHGSTAEAMATVIPWLIEQGYQLVTVSELMAYYYGELLEANKYYNQNYFKKHERTEYPLELPEEPMKTEIPEYTVVPIIPATPPSTEETPEEDPEVPPENDEPTIPPEEPTISPDTNPPQDDTSTGNGDDTSTENEEPLPENEPPATDDSTPEDDSPNTSEDNSEPPPDAGA